MDVYDVCGVHSSNGYREYGYATHSHLRLNPGYPQLTSVSGPWMEPEFDKAHVGCGALWAVWGDGVVVLPFGRWDGRNPRSACVETNCTSVYGRV